MPRVSDNSFAITGEFPIANALQEESRNGGTPVFRTSACLRVCPALSGDDDGDGDSAPAWDWVEGCEHGELYQLEGETRATMASFHGAVYGPDATASAIFSDLIAPVPRDPPPAAHLSRAR